MPNNTTVDLFIAKATAAAATVRQVPNMQASLAYALEICLAKSPCQLLLGEKAGQLAAEKTIAAPLLPAPLADELATLCKAQDVRLLTDTLRNHLGGIDIGITMAEHGIAETGTCVVASDSEEVRLASMIAEIHLVILPKSKIAARSYEIEQELNALMGKDTASFTAFITGPSRTADIERVLAIGVHGPLELHIALVEE